MTRNEQLSFCKVCKNQIKENSGYILCGLTNKPADFETSCYNYVEDKELKEKIIIPENKYFQFTDASQGKRFANYLIDHICIYLLTFILAISLGVILAIVSPSSLSDLKDDNKLLDYLFSFVIIILYYSTFESLTGRTIAKYITGTKVIDSDGNIPKYGIILKRTLCRFIPFEPLSFLGSVGSGWHDSISDTRVVEIK
jgi:uncharacterized RDD family membrane protein YckC